MPRARRKPTVDGNHVLYHYLQKDLRATLAAAERFAIEDYSVALAKGDALPEPERQRIAKEVARLTGLSSAYVMRNNLRIHMGRFNIYDFYSISLEL